MGILARTKVTDRTQYPPPQTMSTSSRPGRLRHRNGGRGRVDLVKRIRNQTRLKLHLRKRRIISLEIHVILRFRLSTLFSGRVRNTRKTKKFK